MIATSTQLLSEVLELITSLAEDWEYEGAITPETLLFGELGLESLDLVVLGTAIQERYGRVPFAEFLTDIGRRAAQDVSIGQLVTFIDQNRQPGSPAPALAASGARSF
ncbi:MAG TPA: acyl carrier protein [Chloroflexota bacterium]|jgi:acyl carrier protein|nr:acyl carrier protein [Chloroflexota bacterium]